MSPEAWHFSGVLLFHEAAIRSTPRCSMLLADLKLT